ncbi:MAG: UDP-N-acetylglucosamine 2-epimerase [Rhodospirillales bacterium]
MRKIAVITGGRADYGLLSGVLCRIENDSDMTLHLIVTGMHTSARFGETGREIEADGLPVAATVPLPLDDDSPAGVGRAMAEALTGVGAALDVARPDLVLVLGDRTEIFAAAQAAMLRGLPLAHIHGGEITEGAMDDAMRHAVTKLSHLHFASVPEYARRIIRMGERPECVFTTGALGADNAAAHAPCPREDFFKAAGLAPRARLFLVTYHPVTLAPGGGLAGAQALCAALERLVAGTGAADHAAGTGAADHDTAVLITGVNSDLGGAPIRACFDAFAAKHADRAAVCESLGRDLYLSGLHHADVVIGNSSSGVIEAPAAGAPSVNIGPRQAGRLRAASVIDCGDTADEITAAVERALNPAFRRTAQSVAEKRKSEGGVAEKIVQVLKTAALDGLLMKGFYDDAA